MSTEPTRRELIDMERKTSRAAMIFRAQQLRDRGYSTADIAEGMGMPESTILSLYEGEITDRVAALEIGRLARNHYLTADQAKAKIRAYLRKEHGELTDEQILEHWESLTNREKMDLIEEALQ